MKSAKEMSIERTAKDLTDLLTMIYEFKDAVDISLS
jgi:hypothetical protein